ncbi:guanylate kinase [Rhodoplanes roseus]|uniref:Guanylate kinase n=1 Tax=Rhodoplanes roseus TaxID=29409 RepID=A0A327KTJ4_9BRAD|nr:guanylate kinase [Rhodoplanes roseus]RAI41597.1 guanylate kinase [Rhodoplanes roseus]
MPADGASTQGAIARRGIMLVVSSPSGAGKTTLTRTLIDEEEHITLSVSVTTRPRRPSEIDGVHYRFITKRQFEIMRDSGDLLEHAEVHGNCYGTPREPVEQALAAGRDVLFDIDWQGTRQLYEAMRDDVVSVFVLPPSAAELKARLERRAEDSEDIIVKRLRNAAEEIAHWPEYDYVLVNRDLDKSFKRLQSILTAERLKRVHRADMESFVDGLLDGLREITA